MSKIQELLAAKKGEANSDFDAAADEAFVSYKALRPGNYLLGGKLERPDESGCFVEEGSPERIADLQSYAARGFLQVQES